jgi:hypothetical protein
MIRAVHPIKKSSCCKSQQPKPSIFAERSHSTEAEESSLPGGPSPLLQCNLMNIPEQAPLQPKVPVGGQQVTGIAATSVSPVIQRYVKVGLYEGSFGLDHIGVGVNSENTKGFSPKEGLGREAEKGSWVDGEVKEDHDLLDSLTIRTNPGQEARLRAALNRAESSPQKFNLRQHNCSQHGAEILKSAGLNAKSSPVPRAFFEGLKKQYASGQKEAASDGGPLQGKFVSNASAAEPGRAAPRPNRTGMPDRLKSGIESLSGMDMSDVRVHSNSELPVRLDALAYTQGNQIYLGPGEEKHLPHEAWHVVQQKQGRVRATRQMKGVGVNDDLGLEREAEKLSDNTIINSSDITKKDSLWRSSDKNAAILSSTEISETKTIQRRGSRSRRRKRWEAERKGTVIAPKKESSKQHLNLESFGQKQVVVYRVEHRSKPEILHEVGKRSGEEVRSKIVEHRLRKPEQGVGIDTTGGTSWFSLGTPDRALANLRQRVSNQMEAVAGNKDGERFVGDDSMPRLKSFKIANEFARRIQRLSVPEDQKTKYPDRPLNSDQRWAPNQFGLQGQHLREMQENAIPGSYMKYDQRDLATLESMYGRGKSADDHLRRDPYPTGLLRKKLGTARPRGSGKRELSKEIREDLEDYLERKESSGRSDEQDFDDMPSDYASDND